MPGIYVRKASWIDWSQKEKNPALTVPGSYWLCHKDNMYKFIFRYHRTARNIKKFNYGKELMKVIRRIIKSEPPQGQQFGTSHLLVTFNRIAWTRQDKMFAMTQFKERSVTAFSHAFVLTIKMSHSLDTEQGTKYATKDSCSIQSFHQDGHLNAVHDYQIKNEKSKKCLMRSPKDDFSEESNQFDNVQKQVAESENRRIDLDNDMVDNSLKQLSVNKESAEQVDNNESRNTFFKNWDSSFEEPIASEGIKYNERMKSNDNYLKAGSVTHNKLSPEKFHSRNTELSRDKKQSDEHDITKNSVECTDTCLSSNSRILNNYSTLDDLNVDSVNLPYQYLIEKEIENAKQNIEKRGLEETNERDQTTHTETNSDTRTAQDSPSSKKKKYLLENVPRSSDITDLVMEGLMFTIRQGQDAVAVIEQKTKLEVDEVLENSEEIETKEGEKRLRNSSLLGLENLITMIELPKEKEHENKCQNVVVKESTLRNQSMSKHLLNDTKYSLTSNEMEESITPQLKHMEWKPCCRSPILGSRSFLNHDVDTGIINKGHYSATYNSSICEEDMEFSKIKDFQYNQKEEEEEEEDIIPEALQNEIFPPSSLSLKADKSENGLTAMPNKDLLMDDIDNEEFTKLNTAESELNPRFSETLQPRQYSRYDCSNDNLYTKSDGESTNSDMNEMHNGTIYRSNFNDSKRCKSNVPVIISNQVISLNQISLPLQKILKNKLSLRGISSHNEDENSENNTDIHKAELCKEQDKVINAQLKSQRDDNILTNAQCIEHHQEMMNDNKETHDETVSFATSKVKLEDTDISENNIKLNKETLQEQNTDKVEELSTSNIKDVTKQFYQDFSYLQRKRNSMNQKYLRSRRKSLNVVNDGNNDEMHIQMVKFFQDITRGAKVVVRRINLNKYS